MTQKSPWAYLLIAHGTRDEEGKAAFFQLADEFGKSLPDRLVVPAFLELAQPSIPEAIETCVKKGAREIFVLPLMLFPGRHVNQDIPRQIQEAKARHPQLDFHYAGALAVSFSSGKRLSEPKLFELLQTKISQRLTPIN